MLNKLTLVFITGLTAVSAQADTQRANYEDPASREETTGFLSGAVLGAAAGGPPGAIFGGAIGAVIGDGWHFRGRVDDLQAELYESQLQMAALREQTRAIEEEYRIAQQELDQLQKPSPQVLPAFLSTRALGSCCDNTVASIHFRTGSSDIEEQYEEQLTSLVKLAEQMNNTTIEISGFADRVGDADANMRLSGQRNESVRVFLKSQGIDDSSITTTAYGESRPLEASQSFETDFFDRRVIVRLRDSGQSMLTQTPDGR